LSNAQVDTRTRDEIAAAIRGFVATDWVRLKAVARKYASGRRLEAEDLLQEALRRSLESRFCPANVDVVRFLAEAMRSIAHGENEKDRHHRALMPVARTGDPRELAAVVPDPALTAEAAMISEQDAAGIRKEVLSLFEDKPQLRDLVEGTMEDLNGQELRELTGLSLTDYNSARRLMRRRIDNAFPKGWKP
jgi:RNA polymerase sigma-70 factor (ECF subfamily)